MNNISSDLFPCFLFIWSSGFGLSTYVSAPVKSHCDNNGCHPAATLSRRKRFFEPLSQIGSELELVEAELELIEAEVVLDEAELDLVEAQQVFRRIRRTAQFHQQFAVASNS